MKIYTKLGDDGYTHLNGKKISKDNVIIRSLGPIDECNGFIALAGSFLSSSKNEIKTIKDELKTIQQKLSDLCAAIVKNTIFSLEDILWLENLLDKYTPNILPIKKFYLPSGSSASITINLARTACRKAERRMTPLLHKKEIDKNILPFLNRLSDFLHVIALEINRLEQS